MCVLHTCIVSICNVHHHMYGGRYTTRVHVYVNRMMYVQHNVDHF